MQQEEEKLLYKCFWVCLVFFAFLLLRLLCHLLAVSCKMLSDFQIGKIICLHI